MFNLPINVKEILKDYKNSLKDYIDNKVNSDHFKGIRVTWGIYSHRGGKFFMARIRIPAGLITPPQLKILASVSKKYGDGILHITTRQDIQIHNIKIENTIKIMEELNNYELSPRGGGGNTVRNIIACPLSGVCEEEVFDVRSYATSLTENLLSRATSFNLPRKFKISFSGCSKDCSGVLVNDIGLLASHKEKEEGFKVFVGGGMGANSRLGKMLEEFIPEEDLGYCVTAIKNIFYRMGDRKNRHHNRLRFLIEDIGYEKFKQYYIQELEALKDKEYISLRKISFPGKNDTVTEIPKIDNKQYKQFLEYNVQSQKQKGFQSVEIRIPQGDLYSQKLEALAGIEKDFKGIEFRLSQNQNLIICWVKNQDVYKLFLRLKEIAGDFLYPETLLDTVSCKGARTCNLGLCNSPDLAKEIEDMIGKNFKDNKLFDKLNIKINGCPNACGQHPVGKLSFHGLVRKVDNRPVPFYKFLIGGKKDAENTRLSEKVGIIPARNIPKFLLALLKELERVIGGKKDLDQFLVEEAKDIAGGILKDFAYVPPYSEDRDFYIDWGKTEEFSLAGIGPGECGAGVIDIIESDLKEAKISLGEAEKENYSFENIKKTLLISSRALLVVKGIEITEEVEVLKNFKEKFIDEGVVSDYFSDIVDVFKSTSKESSLEERKEKFIYAKKLLENIKNLYKNMDSSFNFPKIKQKIQKESNHFLDLKGTLCPLNYVKAKLFLENLESGTILEILLDEGEPMNNVPKSLENDGHQILKKEKLKGFYRILVKNK